MIWKEIFSWLYSATGEKGIKASNKSIKITVQHQTCYLQSKSYQSYTKFVAAFKGFMPKKILVLLGHQNLQMSLQRSAFLPYC